ncbi:type I pantothenate kinase [Mobiluncus holmesii]|uniref:Pantothenate kinase n=2 Tax=Mobiluncus porci TaxID=2652278 RepID=A0A7K0K2C4_9ACTO|nr:type I pantothenate kinase [Mobiluncus porci]
MTKMTESTGFEGSTLSGETSGQNTSWAPSSELMRDFLDNPASVQAKYSNAMREVLAARPEPPRNETPAPSSPFVMYTREQWSALSDQTPLPLEQNDVERLRALGDPLDLAEVDAIYRPLTALLQIYAAGAVKLRTRRADFLGEAQPQTTPFVIGVAGSVAVGKSSVSRLLRELMRRWPGTPRVDLVTTDGFLYPNRVLVERGLMDRKGFPESYDRRALLRFLAAVKSGAPEVAAPVYSHVTYDIIPGKYQMVRSPEVLILEGLNVLAPPRITEGGNSLTVSDFFDFSIYLHARPADIEEWYMARYRQLRATAFRDPNSFFREIASWSDEEAEQHARQIWRDVNLKNLIENVAPTRSRATLILEKSADHRVHRLHLRKI